MATGRRIIIASLVRLIVIRLDKTVLRRPYRRDVQAIADEILAERFPNRMLIARGVLRDHAGIDVFGGTALCGAPVDIWNGGCFQDVRCQLCRGALLASAGRKVARRHHPAGRARDVVVAGRSVDLRISADDQ